MRRLFKTRVTKKKDIYGFVNEQRHLLGLVYPFGTEPFVGRDMLEGFEYLENKGYTLIGLPYENTKEKLDFIDDLKINFKMVEVEI